jgi:hypothetical protein
LHELQLVVSSGDRHRIVVGITDEGNLDRRATLKDSGMEQVVRAARDVLKYKKAGKAEF